MNIPNIPTDNMYKFICISGILIILASYLNANSISNQALDVKMSTDKNTQVLETLGNQLKQTDTKYIQNEQSLKEFNDLVLKIKGVAADISTDGMKIDKLGRDLKSTKTLMNTGFVWTFLGFFGWYYRHQRYLDMIIKNKALLK